MECLDFIAQAQIEVILANHLLHWTAQIRDSNLGTWSFHVVPLAAAASVADPRTSPTYATCLKSLETCLSLRVFKMWNGRLTVTEPITNGTLRTPQNKDDSSRDLKLCKAVGDNRISLPAGEFIYRRP